MEVRLVHKPFNLGPRRLQTRLPLGISNGPITSFSWLASLDMPRGMVGGGVALVGNDVYVWGGVSDGFVIENTTFRRVGGMWEARANMPNARGWGIGAKVGNNLYYAGGYDSGFNPTNTLYEYNPITNLWAEKANMPESLAEGAGTEGSGFLWVGGGWDTDFNISNGFYMYNPAIDVWQQKADLPYPSTTLPVMVSIPDGILSLLNENGNFDNPCRVHVYTIATDLWDEVTAVPVLRPGTLFLEDNVYLFGGQISGIGPTDDVYRISVPAYNVDLFDDLPVVRDELRNQVLLGPDGNVWVLAGWGVGNSFLDDIEVGQTVRG